MSLPAAIGIFVLVAFLLWFLFGPLDDDPPMRDR